jgi:PAS domain-containing protein
MAKNFNDRAARVRSWRQRRNRACRFTLYHSDAESIENRISRQLKPFIKNRTMKARFPEMAAGGSWPWCWSTVYWVLDSILNIFFSNKFNLIAQLIGPDLYDIYIRVVVLCLLVILGSHAQSIINRLNQAKQKLNESEELWRSLVETAPDTIMTVDQSGVIRFINHALSACRRLSSAAGLRPAAGRFQEIAEEIVKASSAPADLHFEICEGAAQPDVAHLPGGPCVGHRVIAATIISTNTTEFKHAEEPSATRSCLTMSAMGIHPQPHRKFIESNDRIEERTGFASPNW